MPFPKLTRRIPGTDSVHYLKYLVEEFNPEKEAQLFYSMYNQGHSLSKLRNTLDISDDIVAVWQVMADLGDPIYIQAICRLVPLRKRALELFDAMVAAEHYESAEMSIQ